MTMPTPKELAEFCAKCADDKLGENIKVISVGAVSSIADYYVIATANSEPQLHALCSEIERRVRDEYKLHPARTDGIGTGGSGRNIKCEFASNGFANTISHRRGVVSMARSDTPNSASSQFFICTADSTHLDGDYAAFGYVIEGMDVVDRVSDKSLAYTQGGVIKDKTKQPVIEYVRVLKDYTEK
jgi:cyclophilin family peptidyl-prolyl cis-trans isomerase